MITGRGWGTRAAQPAPVRRHRRPSRGWRRCRPVLRQPGTGCAHLNPRTDRDVIILTRLGGHQVAVNPDLIERAEPTPDTVLTMFDGHKIVVAESVDEVVAAVRSWRASVAAEAFGLTPAAGGGVDRSVSAPSELVGDDLAAHSALGSSLARVLRLPLSDRDGED